MNRPIRVEVDRDRCVGSGMCAATARATFILDRGGQAAVLDPAGDSLAVVLDAAEGCPTMAIRVTDEVTGEILFPR